MSRLTRYTRHKAVAKWEQRKSIYDNRILDKPSKGQHLCELLKAFLQKAL
jgi:hypothetical protein